MKQAWLAALALLVAGAALADPAAPVKQTGGFVSAGAGQFALAIGTNTTLTPPANGTATGAQICVEGAAIRYTDDGTSATTTVGMPVSAGTCFQYFGPLTKFQATAQSGSPTIDVLYYR